MPTTTPLQLTPEALLGLVTPSDLIILIVLLVSLVLGFRRGLLRTAFSFLGKFAALIGAVIGAKVLAPVIAQYVVMPIVGDVFQQQAAATLQSAVAAAPPDSVLALLDQLSASLQQLFDPALLATAAAPLQEAAAQVAQNMAESLSFVLLFFILLLALTALLRLVFSALHLITHATPLGALDALGGGVLGLACGVLLCILALWALSQFAPATFSELGPLSPAALEKTLLTKHLLGVLSPASALLAFPA